MLKGNGIPVGGTGNFSSLTLNSAISTAGGNITMNQPSGRFRMNAGSSTVVVTNSLATTNSRCFCNITGTVDATMTTIQADCSVAGQITFRGNANATANKDVDFLLVN